MDQVSSYLHIIITMSSQFCTAQVEQGKKGMCSGKLHLFISISNTDTDWRLFFFLVRNSRSHFSLVKWNGNPYDMRPPHYHSSLQSGAALVRQFSPIGNTCNAAADSEGYQRDIATAFSRTLNFCKCNEHRFSHLKWRWKRTFSHLTFTYGKPVSQMTWNPYLLGSSLSMTWDVTCPILGDIYWVISDILIGGDLHRPFNRVLLEDRRCS